MTATLQEPVGLYAQKPASYIKHLLLRQYLEGLAFKVGGYYAHINYVEGFAGPWRSGSTELQDTSPHIAIDVLRRVRDQLAEQQGRRFRIRCLFVEKSKRSAQALRDSLDQYADVEYVVLCGEFQDQIQNILEFLQREPRSFTFTFIDPTGWTGFELERIRPLLEHPKSEVLINLMTSYIQRFYKQSQLREGLTALTGSEDSVAAWNDLRGPQLETAMVETYQATVQNAGRFLRTVHAPVFDPRARKIIYYLVYGTRRIEGLEVFRDVELKVVADQDHWRTVWQERTREHKSGQVAAFDLTEIPQPGFAEFYKTMMARNNEDLCQEMLMRQGTMPFNDLELEALTMPMTRRKMLTDWIQDWKKQGLVEISGLKGRARVPQRDCGHEISWVGDR